MLAEAVFAYIDEISALSAEGYASEQLEAAGETQRRRRRLARLLLEPDQDRDAVAAAAAEAGWPEPARLAALVWAGGDGRMRGRLPAGALLLEEEGGGRRPRSATPRRRERPPRSSARAPGTLAVLGPAVSPRSAARSARPGPHRPRARRGGHDRRPARPARRQRRAPRGAGHARRARRPARPRRAPAGGARRRDAGVARAARAHASLMARSSGRGREGRRPSWTSTRRRSATGWAACGSCSGPRSTTRSPASSSPSPCVDTVRGGAAGALAE